MRRLSIARSVQVALLGLTLVLVAIAGLGVAALYASRQNYEDRLSDALRVEAAGQRLLAASVVEEATLRNARGAQGAAARRTARGAFDQALAATRSVLGDDARSARITSRVAAAQASLRGAGPRGGQAGARLTRQRVADLTARQEARLADARDDAGHESRLALVAIVVGGGLALAGALALVAALLAAVRRPLDDLVAASARLAGGDLGARVDDQRGPDELRLLGRSFNAMAADLEQANARLETERRRLDLTVRSLGDGVVTVEADGRVSSANPRARKLAAGLQEGVTPSEIGLPLPAVEDAASEVLLEHGGRVLAVTANRMDAAGQQGAVVWTLRDATERTRLERLKSEFVATASHELRSPLTSIKGFVELLAAGDGLDARQREFLEIVSVSTNRLVDLVNDLLDVARLEAGRLEVHRRPMDVREVAEEVAALLRPRLDAKQQTLRLVLDDATPRVLADATRVRQILVNLLTNAHLYTDAGGTIEIATGAAPSGVRVEVSDTGRGMSVAELETVFERFSRGSGAAAEARGTGLGLSIVKSLVDLHGGTVDVASTVGEGTTFTVTLPAARRPDGTPLLRDALRGRRVLVLDDDADTARSIADRLLPYGVETELVHDGGQALELLRGGGFDALTLDVLIPGMSGFELLRELRADPVLADLPVVLVSVFSGREALSGEWVVTKPVDAEELADALGAAVMAGRVRVLAVSRDAVRDDLGATLDELGIEHEWATTPLEVGRLCARRHFEVAIVDAGLPEAEAAIAGLELRGRRLRRSVVVVNPGEGTSAGLVRLDADPVPLEEAGAAVLALLDATPAADG